MVDLHDLVRKFGEGAVADVMGRSTRSLRDARLGIHPLTVDDFYVLERAYPMFDALGTIRRIGAIRETKGWSRKKS